MNAEELKEFLSSLRDTDVEELSLESGQERVYFRRGEVTAIQPAAPAADGGTAAFKEKRLIPIRSTMVGTFFYSESQDRPPFVIEGNHIVPGQKVGIIEAMKIMKDMNSNVKGRIVKVLVKNGQPVEYGQDLILVDTENGKS